MKPDYTRLVTCGHFWFIPFETNVMIWFQYVFYCSIEAGRNFETFIASTFGIEPSSSTNVTCWELVTHYLLKSLLSTERQIQYMQLLPSEFLCNFWKGWWDYGGDDVNKDDGPHWDILGCNWAVLDSPGLCWTVVDCTGLYWTTISCTRL